MKKRIFIGLLFIFTMSFSIFAQKFNGGLLVGFTASQVDGDTYSGFNKAGFEGGAFVNRKLNDNFSWQLAIKFIQKGSRHVPDSLNFNDRLYRLHFNYAEVPLSLNYHYKKKFILNLGLEGAYLINFKEESDGYRLYEEANRYFYKFEYSYNIGITYKISKKLLFNLSHSYSILPIRKQAVGSIYKFTRGQFNNLLAFTFYYQFNHEGR